MKLVTVICVVLVVLYGSAEAACEDEACKFILEFEKKLSPIVGLHQ